MSSNAATSYTRVPRAPNKEMKTREKQPKEMQTLMYRKSRWSFHFSGLFVFWCRRGDSVPYKCQQPEITT